MILASIIQDHNNAQDKKLHYEMGSAKGVKIKDQWSQNRLSLGREADSPLIPPLEVTALTARLSVFRRCLRTASSLHLKEE